ESRPFSAHSDEARGRMRWKRFPCSKTSFRDARADTLMPVSARFRTAILGIVGLLASACVPEGPSTADAGAAAQKASPPPPISTSRPKPLLDSGVGVAAVPAITAPFEDAFERAEIGADWNALSPKWRIAGGRLCVRGARNKGIWLNRKL